MTGPPRVVCLGGGYVALGLSRACRSAVQKGKLELTVINRENFMAFHGMVAEMLTGKVQPGAIINPARRVFRPARFHNAEVEAIDLERQTVTTSRSLDGRQYTVPYDHLVLAVGSVDNLSLIPGTAEHALKLKDYADCFKVRNHIVSMLELAEIEEDAEERRRLLTFVVAGGNFAGIEVATELVEYLAGVARKEYRRLDPAEFRVVIVEAGDTILPELRARFPRLLQYADRQLAELGQLGLQVRLATRMAAATAHEAVLDNGERIPTRTIISCTGTAQSPLLDALPFRRDQRGRVVTDEFCRVPGSRNVWAAGDCAAVPHPRGGTSPMLFSYAYYGGRCIAENIIREREGRRLQRFSFTGFGDAISLGRRRAAGHLKGRVPITGFPAWVVWRLLLLYFMPTMDRKLRALLDWLVWPLVGRDIVSVQAGKGLGIEQALYEPGQIILKQGEVGRTVFVIQSGEVDVLEEQPEGERLLAVLGPGDHFGETAVFERVRRTATVRARTRVKLLVLGEEVAVGLSAAVQPLGEELRQVPRKPMPVSEEAEQQA